MLSIPATTAIYLHTAPTDLRKGFDGLSGLVRGQFGKDPTDGSLFLFVNRRRDRLKILHFDVSAHQYHFPSGRWCGRLHPGLTGGRASVGAAVADAVGAVATLLDAVVADRFGMRLAPYVGPQWAVVGLARQELVQHVLDIGPHVEVVAHGAADQREEVGRPPARVQAADKEPVFAA